MLSFDLSIPAIANTLDTVIVSNHFVEIPAAGGPGTGTCTPYEYSKFFTDATKIAKRREFVGSLPTEYLRPDGYVNVISKDEIVDQTVVVDVESDEEESEEEPETETDVDSSEEEEEEEEEDDDEVDFIDDGGNKKRFDNIKNIKKGTGIKSKSYHKKVIKYY